MNGGELMAGAVESVAVVACVLTGCFATFAIMVHGIRAQGKPRVEMNSWITLGIPILCLLANGVIFLFAYPLQDDRAAWFSITGMLFAAASVGALRFSTRSRK
jgi:cytochrome bd-type quinol oxidase subunit 2